MWSIICRSWSVHIHVGSVVFYLCKHVHKFLGHTTKTVTYSSCWLQLINDSTASDAISIKCFLFFRVLLHAGNSYGHFIYLIYVISWGTYSICRLPELIIYLDETKWKNCSCNVLLFGYSDDILNLTQDCVLDYVGKSFFFFFTVTE